MTAVAVMERGELPAVQTTVRAVGLLRPLAEPSAVLAVQNETRAMVKEALKQGRDYGVIPNTDKPALLKPGAERLSLAFGLAPRFRIVEQEIDHDREVKWLKRKKKWRNQFKGDKEFTWVEEAGVSFGLYRYVVECELVHRESGVVVAACLGACSTMESKYVDRPRDVENTILKMAEKRADVGAVILGLGLSDEFTQDTEDLAANGVIDGRGDSKPDPVEAEANDRKAAASDEPEAKCPKCQGAMWDNRKTKTNPKAPDFKCRDRACDGTYWPGQWPPKPKGDPAQSDAFDGSQAPAAPDFAICPAGEHAGKPWSDELAFSRRTLDTTHGYFEAQAADAADPEIPAGYAKAVADELARRDEQRRTKRESVPANTDDIPF